VKFRAATARVIGRLSRAEQLGRLSALCNENARSLCAAVETAQRLRIGAFRVTTPLFPLFTHPELGYALSDLPDAGAIRRTLGTVKSYCRSRNIRLSFHPDQFILLSSPRPGVVESSVKELRYQAMLAGFIGADVINIHAGGAYGDKRAALDRFERQFRKLPVAVRKRLTLENDDVTYTPSDLLPVCTELGIPLVYDVHHHRCNPDRLSVEEATERSRETWARVGREPHFHISSPRNGWASGNPKPHADFIDPADFPACWRDLDVTVDVEAKAKELAVLQLMADLGMRAPVPPNSALD